MHHRFVCDESNFLAGTWQPSADERAYYDQLFTIANSSRSGSVSGQEAVQFLSKSGLEVSVLKEVWNVSDSNNFHTHSAKKISMYRCVCCPLRKTVNL